MTSSDRSLLGFAKQVAKGTLAADGFQYILFSRGSAGVQNMIIPMDTEVGGGAILRDVVKVGVSSGGAVEFIPRPDTLGHFLMAMTGADGLVGGSGLLGYNHIFTLPEDQFSAPYYSVNYAPGNMWGEQYQDCRFSALGLNWKGANFVRGQLAFIGGTPTPGVPTVGWGAQEDVDATSPFVTPVSSIELPTGTNAKVLAGSFQATSAIPMDQQWVVGSYSPDDFDIVQRAYVLNLSLKITDSTLYNKMMYAGNGAVTAWTADVFRQAQFKIEFKTAQNIPGSDPAQPYKFVIEGNGSAAPGGNVVWTAQPVGLRSGQQVVMNVTGVFLADAATPIKLSLLNGHAGAY